MLRLTPSMSTKKLYRSCGLRSKIFFDKETFGADKLVVNFQPRGGGESEDATNESPQLLKQFIREAPIAEQAKRDLQLLYEEPKDYFPGLSSEEKKAKLARISYTNYLRDVAGVHEDIVKLYQALPHGLFGVGIDAVAAQDAWGFDFPGFDGLKLDPTPGKGMNRDAIPNKEAEKYFFHFPDGNASIARLLVRSLFPAAIPGKSCVRYRPRESGICQARPVRFSDTDSPEQHRRAREAYWRCGECERGGSHVCPRWQTVHRTREECGSRLLARHDSLHLRRAA